MSFLTASMLGVTLPCGMDKVLGMEICDQEGEAYDIEGHTITLFLSDSWTFGKVVLEKVGNRVGDSETGRVQFVFEPDDTKGLMCRSYDITITVTEDETGKQWPVLIRGSAVSTLAIIPVVAGEEE